MKVFDKTEHTRTIRGHIDRHELQELLVNHVSNKTVGAKLFGMPGVFHKIEFQDVMEGSPGYKVGDQVTVVLSIDMLPNVDAAS